MTDAMTGSPKVIDEHFYVVLCHMNGEYREIRHFDYREDAVKFAGRSSRYPLIATVHSTVENNPVETWVKGSYFRIYVAALEHAGLVKA